MRKLVGLFMLAALSLVGTVLADPAPAVPAEPAVYYFVDGQYGPSAVIDGNTIYNVVDSTVVFHYEDGVADYAAFTRSDFDRQVVATMSLSEVDGTRAPIRNMLPPVTGQSCSSPVFVDAIVTRIEISCGGQLWDYDDVNGYVKK